MKNETTNATKLYGYALRDAVYVTWLAGVKTLTGAKRAATHRSASPADLRVYRMDASTGRHYVVATRIRGKWHGDIVP